MADTLRWSPTEFWTPNFDPSKAHLRRTETGNFALSAGRTWTQCSVTTGAYLSQRYRPFRFNMGSAATARNFVIIQPDGAPSALNQGSNTPAVNPVVTTANIA